MGRVLYWMFFDKLLEYGNFGADQLSQLGDITTSARNSLLSTKGERALGERTRANKARGEYKTGVNTKGLKITGPPTVGFKMKGDNTRGDKMRGVKT